MAVTPRTRAYLQGTSFAAAQPAGSIGSDDVQEFTESVPFWDTIGGVAAPNVLRGTLDVQKYFIAQGGAVGSMSGTPSQRVTNATALQAAYTYATTNGLMMEQTPADYEINGAVRIPAVEGVVFRGAAGFSLATNIIQFATNIPVLTLSYPILTEVGRWDFSGISLNYGVSQAGQTAALTCVFGSLDASTVKNVLISPNGTAGYDGMTVNSGFSNVYGNFIIKAFQRNGFNAAGSTGTTGSSYNDFYMSPGAFLSPGAITGSCINISNAGIDDFTMRRYNLEWFSGNAASAINATSTHGATFESGHIEGCFLTGADPYMVSTTSGNMHFGQLNLIDLNNASATGMSVLFRDWSNGGGNTLIDGLCITDNNRSSYVTHNLQLFWPAPETDGDNPPMFVVNGLGGGNFGGGTQVRSNAAFDWQMPLANFNWPLWIKRYEFNFGASRVIGAVILVSATYTHYGQHQDATILVPGTITPFTLTLATRASATVGSLPVRPGTTLVVRRRNETFSGNLTISFGGTGSPITNSANNTSYYFRVDNSGVWQTFTAA